VNVHLGGCCNCCNPGGTGGGGVGALDCFCWGRPEDAVGFHYGVRAAITNTDDACLKIDGKTIDMGVFEVGSPETHAFGFSGSQTWTDAGGYPCFTAGGVAAYKLSFPIAPGCCNDTACPGFRPNLVFVFDYIRHDPFGADEIIGELRFVRGAVLATACTPPSVTYQYNFLATSGYPFPPGWSAAPIAVTFTQVHLP